MGGGGAYRETSLVSAVTLARIGPVRPFFVSPLIAHSEACGPTEDEPLTHSRKLAQRHRRRVGGEPGSAKGTHRDVSAVSAESVGGTLPVKRFSPRALRHNVPRLATTSRPGDRTERTGRPAW